MELDVSAMPDDSWETCVSAGIALAADMDAHRWQLGDLAGRVTGRYGEDALGNFATEIGMANKSTLRGYKRVAERFEKVSRETWGEAGMTFSHFRAAMVAGDDAELWLARAADDGLTVKALGRAIKEATGLPVPPRLLYSGRGVVWQYANDSRPYLVLHEDVSALVQGLAVTIKVYEAEAQS